MTLSATISASSSSWVTCIAVLFLDLINCLVSVAKVRLELISNEENGSSKSSTSGFASNALANATLCDSPPESDSTFLLAKPGKPMNSSSRLITSL